MVAVKLKCLPYKDAPEREETGLGTQLLLFESGSHWIAQAGLELVGSNDPLASVFGVAGTKGTCPLVYMFKQPNKECEK